MRAWLACLVVAASWCLAENIEEESAVFNSNLLNLGEELFPFACDYNKSLHHFHHSKLSSSVRLSCPPSPSPEPNINSLMNKYAEVIKGTTFLFIGDSTMEYQFSSLCSIFRGNNRDSSGANSKSHLGDDFSLHCSFPGNSVISGTKLEFIGYGQTGYWDKTLEKSHLERIRSFIKKLGSGDVVIFNAGLHWQYNCPASVGDGKNYGESFEQGFFRLLYMLTGGRKDCCCHNNAANDKKFPLFIFRDSVPQHFNTSNGEYTKSGHASRERCVAMTHERYHGVFQLDQTLPQCTPNCRPANWRNILAKRILGHMCISSFDTWHEVACLTEHHHPKNFVEIDNTLHDCSHYNSSINVLLNARLLQHYAQIHSKMQLMP